MKKLKRSGRLVDMTNFLLQHPHELISLGYFTERYDSAKSSVSEDLTIIKEIFETQGVGALRTVAGASGGVRYVPKVEKSTAELFVGELCEKLENKERLLPGGYLYMMDILGRPRTMNEVGKMFASVFADRQIDAIVTVAMKGIPLGHAIGTYLDVPVSIVRRDHRVTEGSTVSINYVSGSSRRIQTMSLARRSLPEGSNVLVVDDFMKAGGTVSGMIELLQEFRANVAGIGVLVEAEGAGERLVDDYVSIARVEEVNEKTKNIRVVPGNFLTKLEKEISR